MSVRTGRQRRLRAVEVFRQQVGKLTLEESVVYGYVFMLPQW